MMKYTLLAGCLVFTALVASCKDKAETQKQPSSSPSANSNSFSGKVVETMNAGDYTYVEVDTGKSKNWVAAPRFAVKVGDTAAVANSMPMPKYRSKILNRDFEVVYFTERVTVNGVSSGASGEMAMPKDHPPIGSASTPMPVLPQDHPPVETLPQLPKDHPPIDAAAKPSIDVAGIQRAEGGKTVAEVYAEKASLNGKEVKVRGKVVKYSAMIMGKNWIHLRDGTGGEGSNDLLVTSTSATKVGDTIVATGTVSANKDFGANYKYAVMMEDAKLSAE